jgi:DNA polymerase III epsilon subunit-like protein
MTKIYSTMPHLNGNVLAAIDFETTGTRPGYHEPIQIAVVPLNSDVRPLEGVRPFYMNIRPLYPDRAERAATARHGLDVKELAATALHPERVADLLIEWWENLELPFLKSLVPLAHNWAFENGFLKAWLGEELTDRLFFSHARDAMTYALSLNDKSFVAGEKAPFNKVSLTSLCNVFGVVNERPHDALSDSLAEAEVYRHLLRMDVF